MPIISSPPSKWTSNGSDIFYDRGNVGIGTTTPSQKLHISGGHVLVSEHADPTVRLQSNSGSPPVWAIKASSLGDFNIGRVGIADDFTVLNSSGNVGIGTTSPQGKLDIATAATNDDVSYFFQQARVATTDATVTTLDTFAITASRTYVIDSRVVARRTGGLAGTADDGAVYIRRAMVTTKAGTVTINAVQDGLTQEDQVGWDCTMTVSGANVLLRVTGAVDNNITWHATSTVSWVGT